MNEKYVLRPMGKINNIPVILVVTERRLVKNWNAIINTVKDRERQLDSSVLYDLF